MSDRTDYLGHALELESAAKKVESQTAERAMESGAQCLRNAEIARAAHAAEIARLSAALSEALAQLEAERARNAAIRSDALEEAARICEENIDPQEAAFQIRELIGPAIAIIPGETP